MFVSLTSLVSDYFILVSPSYLDKISFVRMSGVCKYHRDVVLSMKFTGWTDIDVIKCLYTSLVNQDFNNPWITHLTTPYVLNRCYTSSDWINIVLELDDSFIPVLEQIKQIPITDGFTLALCIDKGYKFASVMSEKLTNYHNMVFDEDIFMFAMNDLRLILLTRECVKDLDVNVNQFLTSFSGMIYDLDCLNYAIELDIDGVLEQHSHSGYNGSLDKLHKLRSIGHLPNGRNLTSAAYDNSSNVVEYMLTHCHSHIHITDVSIDEYKLVSNRMIKMMSVLLKHGEEYVNWNTIIFYASVFEYQDMFDMVITVKPGLTSLLTKAWYDCVKYTQDEETRYMDIEYMLYNGLVVSNGDYSRTGFDVVDVYMDLDRYCNVIDLKTGLIGGLELALTWLDFNDVEYDTLFKLISIVVGRERLDDILRLDKEDRLRFICFSMKALNALR